MDLRLAQTNGKNVPEVDELEGGSAAAAPVGDGSEISVKHEKNVPEAGELEGGSAATAALPVVVRFTVWSKLQGESIVGGPVAPFLKAPPYWTEGPGLG